MQRQRIVRTSVGTELPRVPRRDLSTPRGSVEDQRGPLPEGEFIFTIHHTVIYHTLSLEKNQSFVKGIFRNKEEASEK